MTATICLVHIVAIREDKVFWYLVNMWSYDLQQTGIKNTEDFILFSLFFHLVSAVKCRNQADEDPDQIAQWVDNSTLQINRH